MRKSRLDSDFTLGAALDITKIWEFIALDNVRAAGRVREELLRSFRLLAKFPDMGHVRLDLAEHGIRFQVVRSFLIAYVPAEKPTLILAVLHGRRSPRTIATVLKGRS